MSGTVHEFHAILSFNQGSGYHSYFTCGNGDLEKLNNMPGLFAW